MPPRNLLFPDDCKWLLGYPVPGRATTNRTVGQPCDLGTSRDDCPVLMDEMLLVRAAKSHIISAHRAAQSLVNDAILGSSRSKGEVDYLVPYPKYRIGTCGVPVAVPARVSVCEEVEAESVMVSDADLGPMAVAAKASEI